MRSGFRMYNPRQYLTLHLPNIVDPAYNQQMNHMNSWLETDPPKFQRPVSPSEVYIAPKSLQEFNVKNKQEKFELSDLSAIATKDPQIKLNKR